MPYQQVKIWNLIFKPFIFLILIGISPDLANCASLPGQIIVDPANPAWLKYNEGGPLFICGPGDPEGFLYRGLRNSDGTRNGDQMALINKLKNTGANCIYLIAVRSHGGDGDASQNPFVNSDPSQGLDQDILNQWETWFAAMDTNGIVIYFFFYDDNARIWKKRIWNLFDSVRESEIDFIESIVNRFKHHRNLIWVVAEEYEEAFDAGHVSNLAAVIRSADDRDHPIAVHKNCGLDFSEFADDPNIDQFAIQFKGTSQILHNGMVTAWIAANGKFNLNMAEAAGHGTGSIARKKNWAIAMGGAYVMVFGWDIIKTKISDLEDCGRLVHFMESTNFNEMAPHDELRYGGTEYVMALPGESYIAYASSLSNDIGLKNVKSGIYSFKWFDVTNGNTVIQDNVDVIGGDQTWSKPKGIGNEIAVYVRLVN